jgi:NADPH:quinone reductase-like Zn-dependent oxidoreductase
MKAAVIDEFGPLDNLHIAELPKPVPGPGQLLVQVHAAAVNPIDWKIRNGWMQQRFGDEFPMVLGFDASGVIVETGDDAGDFAKGDEVYTRSVSGPGGCYAEFVVVDASVTAPKPANFSHAEAAATPLAALTALNGLRDCGELQPGQHVLIVGASGGVGTYAVQIAKNIGAEVTATCSSGNVPLVRELGADHVMDYTRDDVLSMKESFDLVYDTVGALPYPQASSLLRGAGVYMTLVPVEGIEFFTVGQTARKAGGGYFLIWAPSRADLEVLTGWAEAGHLRSVIDSEFPLEGVRAAHERSETERARGKIIIRVRD